MIRAGVQYLNIRHVGIVRRVRYYHADICQQT
jgi:hypothetical protein